MALAAPRLLAATLHVGPLQSREVPGVAFVVPHRQSLDLGLELRFHGLRPVLQQGAVVAIPSGSAIWLVVRASCCSWDQGSPPVAVAHEPLAGHHRFLLAGVTRAPEASGQRLDHLRHDAGDYP